MGESIGTTERQLNLLSALLKAREPLGWAELSAVSGYQHGGARTRQKRLERDIKALEHSGIRIARSRHELTMSYELDRAACLMPPVNLTPEQRVLLYRVGLAYLPAEERGPLHENLSSALMKLQAGAGGGGLPARLPPAVIQRTLRRSPGDSRRLDVICPALLERRIIRFRYAGRAGRAAATRTVAPYALVARRGGWYLVGYDLGRKGERTFRLSRMRGEIRRRAGGGKGPEYEIPDGFDPERSFSAEVFGSGDDAFRNVRIEFDAEVAFIVENEFEGLYRISRRRDGSIVLHLPQAWPEELFRYLGEFPGHWRVLQPRALAQLVVRRLKAALKNAGRGRP